MYLRFPMLRIPALALLAAASIAPLSGDSTTLIHYRVSSADNVSSSVPNLGNQGPGDNTGTGVVTLSSDIPTNGVPPGLGDRSLSFPGDAGVKSPGTRQLLNSEILSNGGFAYETWFKFTGGTGLNSIIDYAGTEKIYRPDPGTSASIQTNNSIFDSIGAAAVGDWHYVAVVFHNVTSSDGGLTVTGDYTYYFDGTAPVEEVTGITISDFGDSLNRSIGVGMHPAGFSGDFFNGLIFEPRVTLGPLDRTELLYNSIIVTTTSDDDDGSLDPTAGGATGISLREAVNHSPPGTNITFDISLSGSTIHLGGTQLTLDQDLTINASSLPNGITIDAGQASRIMEVQPAITASLEGLTFTHGHASGSSPANRGGAIYNNGATLAITSCSFLGNESAGTGGAVYNNTSSPSIINCTFQGNAAGQGGAIYNTGASPVFLNCSIQGNSAASAGGAILNANSSSPSFTNCIIWGNAANNVVTTQSASVFNSSSTPTFSHCLVQNWDPSALSGTDNLNGINPSNNPRFLAAVNPYNAPVTGGDLRIFSGSPVLDAGDDAANDNSFDLAGNSRIHGTAIDLGAYEQHGFHHVRENANGTDDGSSWTDAFPTLQDALAAAQPGSMILVAKGTYYPDEGLGQTNDDRSSTFNIPSGVVILGGFPENGGNLSSRIPAKHATTLSGDLQQNDGTNFANNADNATNVLRAISSSSATYLDGFTISGGNRNSTLGGGGLFCVSSSFPVIVNCDFLGNYGTLGGAVYCNTASSPSFVNCSFKGNSSSSGGAVLIRSSSPSFTNCSFQGNQTNNVGGAVANIQLSSTSFINCSFQGNASESHGGAISFDTTSLASLSNCLIWNNAANFLTSTQSASINTGNTIAPTYSRCIIQNWTAADLGSPNNFDGTDPLADPLFIAETNPLSAPTTHGSLGLRPASPARDLGDDSTNTHGSDIAGNSRKSGTIDLGAWEFQGTFFVRANGGNDANNGLSWGSAFATLQRALASATSGQAILLASGTYYPDEGTGQTDNDRASTFTIPSSVQILGGFPEGGGPTRNPNLYPSILSGDLEQNDEGNFSNHSDNTCHILTADDSTSETLLDGLTLQGGNCTTGSSNGSGAALHCLNSSFITVTNCTFQENAANFGAAIYNERSSPTITSCSFFGNSAQFGGGAICNTSSSPAITNGLFQGNYAQIGGAIYNNASGGPACSPDLVNCSFQGNAAELAGGAILNEASLSGEVFPTLTNCIIWNNAANASTTTPGASVENSGSTPTYLRSLVHNWNPTDLGSADNLNGTLSTSNPNFLAESPALAAPTIPTFPGGLRLLARSPALDNGRGSSNIAATDLAGNPRIHDSAIDLGAFEQQGILFVRANQTAPSNDGSTWTNAYPTLKRALVNSLPGGTVLVAEGTYYPDEIGVQNSNLISDTFNIPSGLVVLGGFPADGGAPSSRNPATQTSLLSGDIDQNGNSLDNALRILTADACDRFTLLDGFTISHGIETGLSSSNSAIPTISNCVFNENGSYNDGIGAIHNDHSSPSVVGCIFRGNQSFNGPAVHNINSASPSIINSEFQGNLALDEGGAIYNENSSPSIINCTFQGNRAEFRKGCVIYNVGSSPSMINSIIWGNAPDPTLTHQVTSVSNDGNSNPNYSHCLIQNLDLSGSDNNLDGTELGNDPLFVSEIDPNSAPTATAGCLRLRADSPLLDIGNNHANPRLTDIADHIRMIGTIDLGAWEHQGTLHVSSFDGDDSDDGTTWATAFATLKKALETVTPGQAILLTGGIYYPDEIGATDSDDRNATFDIPSSIDILGGFDPTTPDFASRNPATHVTTLSGDLDQNDHTGGDNSNNAYHVVSTRFINDETALDGLTISAGNADATAHTSSGGGLYSITSTTPTGATTTSPTFTNCIFQENSATSGGAIACINSSPRFTNCIIQGNSAASGGAVENERSSPRFINCTVQGNQGINGTGGMRNDIASPSLINCIFWGNSTQGVTDTERASLRNINSSPSFSHCLVQNWSSADLGGSGNLDGTHPANNPMFVAELDPLTAPTTGGDLRFFYVSPALDTGRNSVNRTPSDLAGNPRIQDGTIDLGALEGVVTDPAILWDTDFDQDGLAYGLEIATGTNPDTENEGSPLAYSLHADGTAIFAFNRAPLPSSNYILKIMRSTTLAPGSFTHIFSVTPSTLTGTVSESEDLAFPYPGFEDSFILLDNNPPADKAFYVLEAEFVAD